MNRDRIEQATRTLPKNSLMRIESADARMSRATVLLLVLGLSTGSSGAWLLQTVRSAPTAQELARAETKERPSASSATTPALFADATGTAHGCGVNDVRVPRRTNTDSPVAVRAKISSRVTAMHFAVGSQVEEGETLLVLDAAPFAAAVEKAVSAVSAARNRLAAATVALGAAQRAFEAGRIDVNTLDASVLAQRQAIGALQAAARARESALSDLAATRIIAPIGGRVVEVHVNVGDRVAAAPEGRVLLTIASGEPIYAGAQVERPSVA